eukprot:1143834-Pelagomonas_calceolata.AAC.6
MINILASAHVNSSAFKIPIQDSIRDLRYRHQKVWREADAFSPREVNRKAVTYNCWRGNH